MASLVLLGWLSTAGRRDASAPAVEHRIPAVVWERGRSLVSFHTKVLFSKGCVHKDGARSISLEINGVEEDEGLGSHPVRRAISSSEAKGREADGAGGNGGVRSKEGVKGRLASLYTSQFLTFSMPSCSRVLLACPSASVTREVDEIVCETACLATGVGRGGEREDTAAGSGCSDDLTGVTWSP